MTDTKATAKSDAATTKAEASHDHAAHDHAAHDHAGHDHAGHDHAGHDHAGHDHKHDDLPNLVDQDAEAEKKLNRGEKKCRKSLLKLGMKQLTGITRVTLKKRDGLIFVINDPEVLKSGSTESSFAIFGELKLEDPNTRLAGAAGEAKKFAEKDTVKSATAAPTKKAEDKKVEDDGAPLSEEGLTPNHIDMVMQHATCSRNAAIKALKEANDDMVAAVMKLTQ
jgi:nascent polypeptide-associated complex subunit alpha